MSQSQSNAWDDLASITKHPHPALIVWTYIAYCTDCFLFYCGAVRDTSRMFTVYQALLMVPVIWVSCDLVVSIVIKLYRRWWLSWPKDHPMLSLIAMAVFYTLAMLFIGAMTLALYLTAWAFPLEFVEGYSLLNALRDATQIALFTGLSTLASWKFGLKDLKLLLNPWWRLFKFTTNWTRGTTPKLQARTES